MIRISFLFLFTKKIERNILRTLNNGFRVHKELKDFFARRRKYPVLVRLFYLSIFDFCKAKVQIAKFNRSQNKMQENIILLFSFLKGMLRNKPLAFLEILVFKVKFGRII